MMLRLSAAAATLVGAALLSAAPAAAEHWSHGWRRPAPPPAYYGYWDGPPRVWRHREWRHRHWRHRGAWERSDRW